MPGVGTREEVKFALPQLHVDVSAFEGKLNAEASTLITLHSGTAAYDAIKAYPDFTSAEKAKGMSFELVESKDRPKNEDEESESDDSDDGSWKKPSTLSLSLGQGVHTAEFKGRTIHVSFQSVGMPVSTNCGATMLKYMIVAVEGRRQQEFLHGFVDYAIVLSNTCDDNTTIKVYRWHTRYSYWQQQRRQLKRPISTIILDRSKMKNIVDDVKDFQSARKWYMGHGIPYKRCYMFFGPPGTGKSSTIRALASHFDRALCFLQPSDEHCTDESFKKAMETAPQNALIAIEDIDALFDAKRKSQNNRCPLTFSGLLNGIDGIGAPHGQIIMMTTNYMDRLDPALIRAGRCDVTVKMDHASPKQIQEMFLRFYEGEAKEAERFSERLESVKALSMAALQNHFIIHRKSTAKQAVDELLIHEGKLILLNKGQSEEAKEELKKASDEELETGKKVRGKNDDGDGDDDDDEDVKLPEDASEWTEKHVLKWAKKQTSFKGNKDIRKHLKTHSLDGPMLLEYSVEDMLEDGLSSRGSRVRLARAIKDLKCVKCEKPKLKKTKSWFGN